MDDVILDRHLNAGGLINSEDCLFVVRFFMANHSVKQQAMTWVVGPVLHVEVIIVDKQRPTLCTMSFTAFVDCALAMYVTPMSSLMDATVLNLSFPISQTVATRLGDCCLQWHTSKIPYNWYDSRFLMPFLNAHLLDVVSDVHGDPTQLFCSQMVVVLMRQCMDATEDGELIDRLYLLNSRLTSPRTLLRILGTCGNPMTSTALRDIVGQGFKASQKNTFNV
jgi:hypothetical protein